MINSTLEMSVNWRNRAITDNVSFLFLEGSYASIKEKMFKYNPIGYVTPFPLKYLSINIYYTKRSP